MRKLSLAALAAPFLLIACGGADDSAPSDETMTKTATDKAAEMAKAEMAKGQSTEAAKENALIPAPEGSKAGGTMALGAEDAPLTIIEYADLACPACAAFHAQILPEIKEKYIETGKVRFEFREYPVTKNKHAYAGFYIARCAATNKGAEAYFAALNTLFDRQGDWRGTPNAGDVLQNIAAQTGMDRERYRECLYREDVREAVSANILKGQQGEDGPVITATPSFVVDGKIFDWGYSKQGMIDAIDAELAKRVE